MPINHMQLLTSQETPIGIVCAETDEGTRDKRQSQMEDRLIIGRLRSAEVLALLLPGSDSVARKSHLCTLAAHWPGHSHSLFRHPQPKIS